jgi:hypothetical protein
MFDLDALAAEVAAVLDRHESEETFCTTEGIPFGGVTTKLWCGGERWDCALKAGEPVPFFSGRVTPAAFAALSAVYARVHGEE